MKFVHTSDWHIGKSLNNYSLLEDQRYWFNEFIQELSQIKPDALFVSGDIYDRSVPSAEAVSLFDKIISEIVLTLKIKTFIIAGNHDSKERLSFSSGILAQSGLYMVGKIKEDIDVVHIDNADIYMLPYHSLNDIRAIFPDESFKSAEEAISFMLNSKKNSLDNRKINIIICHGTFSDNWSDISDEVGGSEVISSSVFSEFDYVAMGHLHSYISSNKNKMIYPSSPLKYSIDEQTQKKGFVEVDIDKNGVTPVFHTIKPLRDVYTARGRFNDIIKEKSDDYIFFELTDEAPVLNGFIRLKHNYPFALGIKYISVMGKQAEQIKRNRNKAVDPKDIFAEFYKSVTDKPLNKTQEIEVENIFAEISEENNDTD